MIRTAKSYRRQTVKTPGYRPPMEHAVARCPKDRRITSWVYAKGWRIVVKCPLHRSRVNQRTADTGAEEHRSPTEFGMGRSDSVGTENNPAKVADADPEQEKKYRACGRLISTGGMLSTKGMVSYLARRTAIVEGAKPCDNAAVLAFRSRLRR